MASQNEAVGSSKQSVRDRFKEKYFLASREETIALGQIFAKLLPKGSILALSGDLGAGKTTFVQGLAEGLGISEPIQSPTFILLNLYEGLFHFDLYRMKKTADFLSLGFEEYFVKEGICCIEWPDRIAEILPSETIYIHFAYENEGRIAFVN
jgi:tRNA threonylcarbamoyladenosine biosynthesis protein TsaE